MHPNMATVFLEQERPDLRIGSYFSLCHLVLIICEVLASGSDFFLFKGNEYFLLSRFSIQHIRKLNILLKFSENCHLLRQLCKCQYIKMLNMCHKYVRNAFRFSFENDLIVVY